MLKHSLSNTNNNQKEWQFLQTAINEAGLTDFYQTYNELTNSTGINAIQIPLNSSSIHSKFNNISSGSNNENEFSSMQQSSEQLASVSNHSIETILQMQSELLEQQKELKNIELETMDHLQQLHHNISRLASKFDLFELSLQTQLNNNLQHSFNNININMNQENQSNSTAGIKTVKNVFNKLNSTIGQHIKVSGHFII